MGVSFSRPERFFLSARGNLCGVRSDNFGRLRAQIERLCSGGKFIIVLRGGDGRGIRVAPHDHDDVCRNVARGDGSSDANQTSLQEMIEINQSSKQLTPEPKQKQT